MQKDDVRSSQRHSCYPSPGEKVAERQRGRMWTSGGKSALMGMLRLAQRYRFVKVETPENIQPLFLHSAAVCAAQPIVQAMVLNQNAVAVIRLMLNDLGSPAVIEAGADLHFFVLIANLDGAVAQAFAGAAQ